MQNFLEPILIRNTCTAFFQWRQCTLPTLLWESSGRFSFMKHHLRNSQMKCLVINLTTLAQWEHIEPAAAAKSLQSCPTPCDPIDGSPPGSSVPGILQARILEWVTISFSNACMHAKSPQLCPTLGNPMDSSPPGSSIHRILQARILEWATISFSRRGKTEPCALVWRCHPVFTLLLLCHLRQLCLPPLWPSSSHLSLQL